MDHRYFADVIVGLFHAGGIDGETVKNKNEQWVAKITRDDGRLVCVSDDTVALYESESDFLDGSATDAISLR